MTESHQRQESFSRLPWSDYLILPLIVVVTLLFLAGGGEFIARSAFPTAPEISCAIHTVNGIRYRPLCVAFSKAIDGPWVENRFNDCGYRTDQSCKVTPATRLRVAVVGSSIARGHEVPYPETFAARTSAALSRACGETVDFQNLGTHYEDILKLGGRMHEAVALRSRVIILLITASDLQHLDDVDPVVGHPPPERGNRGLSLIEVMDGLRKSYLFLVAQHFLYRDPAVQVTAFLRNGIDDMNGYVVNPLPPKWQTRIGQIDGLLKRMTAITNPAGVKVILVYVPRRVHAVLEMPRYANPRVDTHVLDRALSETARANGVDFIDTTPDFANYKDFNSLYFLADGHPSGAGHALIASAVQRRLLEMPAFRLCRSGAS
jgi:hypothetical protein